MKKMMIQFKLLGFNNRIAVNPAMVTSIEECKMDNTTKIYFTAGEDDFFHVEESFDEVIKKFQEVK